MIKNAEQTTNKAIGGGYKVITMGETYIAVQLFK